MEEERGKKNAHKHTMLVTQSQRSILNNIVMQWKQQKLVLSFTKFRLGQARISLISVCSQQLIHGNNSNQYYHTGLCVPFSFLISSRQLFSFLSKIIVLVSCLRMLVFFFFPQTNKLEVSYDLYFEFTTVYNSVLKLFLFSWSFVLKLPPNAG